MTDRQDILRSLDLTSTSYSPTGDYDSNFSGDEATILELYSRDHDHTITVNSDQTGVCQVYDDSSTEFSGHYSTARDVAREIQNRMQS